MASNKIVMEKQIEHKQNILEEISRQPPHQRKIDIVSDRKDRFGTYVSYGFGEPFSYWKDYELYPLCEAKYKNLQDELLNNTICNISKEKFNVIHKKSKQIHSKIQNILGQNGDKNTPHARCVPHWNEICNIPYNRLISLNHLNSILFYTDLTTLPKEMKIVCRKIDTNDTFKLIKKRHCEYVNWLKLLTETIFFYGNKLSPKDQPIYHGLNNRFLFDEFKAKFHIPTSTSTAIDQAYNFAQNNGIVLEFGGLDSDVVNCPYFDTTCISLFPHEQEYLFFRAELNMTNIYISKIKFSMRPLSLYQSIVNGSIIIDKQQLNKNIFKNTQTLLNKYLKQIDEKKDNNDDAEIYGIELLKNFINKNKQIYINETQIRNKIGMKKLRERFIEENKDKSLIGYKASSKLIKYGIKIKTAYNFEWKLKQKELKSFINEEIPGIASRPKKCKDKSRFYFQLYNSNIKNNKINEETGRISLVLLELPNKQINIKKISCDFYCKQMNKFYIRFHNQILKIGTNNAWDSRITAIFNWEKFKNAFKNNKCINWTISIRDQSD